MSAGHPPGVAEPVVEIYLIIPPYLGVGDVTGFEVVGAGAWLVAAGVLLVTTGAGVVVTGFGLLVAGLLVVAGAWDVVGVEEEHPESIKAQISRIDATRTDNFFNLLFLLL